MRIVFYEDGVAIKTWLNVENVSESLIPGCKGDDVMLHWGGADDGEERMYKVLRRVFTEDEVRIDVRLSDPL